MPKLPDNAKGFTLIEILVVIVIIAILSSTVTLYYVGIQGRARDSARRIYVLELVTALEINKSVESYQPFGPGQLTVLTSIDPGGNAYCIAAGMPPDPGFSVPWEATCPSGFETVAAGVPTGGDFTSFKVCAYLEQPVAGPHVFCRSGAL
jgi:prepilin-type N-terminal cleavage/methylation domain-containing protein